MNITDIPTKSLFEKVATHYGVEGPLEVIFARQEDLLQNYLPVEEEILDRRISFDLHTAQGQENLKARAWWFVEEICEALEAMEENNKIKAVEEFSDALHFLTELCIVSGVGPDDVELDPLHDPSTNIPRIHLLHIIMEVGLAMWQLRNKPWKKTQIPTDIPRLKMHLIRAYKSFIYHLVLFHGLELREIAVLYLRKSEVNKFRIQSNY